MEIKQSFDGFIEKTEDVMDTAHEKTEQFHKNYVSKVIPDFGKYGDKAKFVAEMLPGVSEYNAIKDGDWQAFAIDAGMDIGSFAVGTLTAGTGYVAAKTGAKLAAKEVAEAGVEKAVKEVAEAGTKKAVKEVAEAGTKKTVKEIAEEGAEKAVKEVAEAGTEKAAKEIAEAGTEKTAKEVVKRLDKTLMKDYFKEVERVTRRKLDPVQLKKLNKELKEQDFCKLDKEKLEQHKRIFNSVRDKLIHEWEANTGQTWPVYTEDVLSKTGEVIRRKGQPYDVHHLIEESYGGPNEWWNLHPAAFPNEHQGGIHGANSLANKIFK